MQMLENSKRNTTRNIIPLQVCGQNEKNCTQRLRCFFFSLLSTQFQHKSKSISNVFLHFNSHNEINTFSPCKRNTHRARWTSSSCSFLSLLFFIIWFHIIYNDGHWIQKMKSSDTNIITNGSLCPTTLSTKSLSFIG